MRKILLVSMLVLSLVHSQDFPFEMEPYVDKTHRENLSVYGVDIDNAVKLLADCYTDNRRLLRVRFENNADMAIKFLKLDPAYRKEYIGVGSDSDIVSDVDFMCSDYPEYDQFVAELKVASYRNSSSIKHDKFMDALGQFILIEFGNISEEIDGEF